MPVGYCLIDDEREIDAFPSSTTPDVIARCVGRLIGRRNALILAGVNLSPRLVPLIRCLKQSFRGAKAFYDVFDDFRYNARGLVFLKRLGVDLMWRRECVRPLVLEKGLKRIYPLALHFDNASHIRAASKNAAIDPRRLVYIGSIDRRVDFEWLDALADLDITLDTDRRVHDTAPELEETLRGFLARHRNAAFLALMIRTYRPAF